MAVSGMDEVAPFAATRKSRLGSPRVLKKSSSWPSLSKSAAITVRTAEGKASRGRGVILPGAVVATDHEPVRTILVRPAETQLAIARVEGGNAATGFLGLAQPDFGSALRERAVAAIAKCQVRSPLIHANDVGMRSHDRQCQSAAPADDRGDSQRWGEVSEQVIRADLEETDGPATVRDEEAVSSDAAAVDRRHTATRRERAKMFVAVMVEEIEPLTIRKRL